MEITNRNIIITGAASGIGKSLLFCLSAFRGLSVVAVDLQETALRQTIAELPPSTNLVIPYVCDVSTPEAVDALFDFAQTQMGSVDIFFANAGFAYYEQLQKPDWPRMEAIFRVNTLSPLYSLQKMVACNAGREYAVVITASAIAKLGIPGYALYGATKAALDRFADAYRYETDDLGHLCLVYPISTRTAFFDNSVSASWRGNVPVPFPSLPPETVAKAMIRGVLKDQKFVYPSLLHRVGRFVQYLAELMFIPYQLYYARVLRKWFLNG